MFEKICNAQVRNMCNVKNPLDKISIAIGSMYMYKWRFVIPIKLSLHLQSYQAINVYVNKNIIPNYNMILALTYRLKWYWKFGDKAEPQRFVITRSLRPLTAPRTYTKSSILTFPLTEIFVTIVLYWFGLTTIISYANCQDSFISPERYQA